jgi:hypothetical protein
MIFFVKITISTTLLLHIFLGTVSSHRAIKSSQISKRKSNDNDIYASRSELINYVCVRGE